MTSVINHKTHVLGKSREIRMHVQNDDVAKSRRLWWRDLRDRLLVWEHQISIETGIVMIGCVVNAVVVRQLDPELITFYEHQNSHITSGSGALSRSFPAARATGIVKSGQESLSVLHQVKQYILAMITDPTEAHQICPVHGRSKHPCTQVKRIP